MSTPFNPNNVLIPSLLPAMCMCQGMYVENLAGRPPGGGGGGVTAVGNTWQLIFQTDSNLVLYKGKNTSGPYGRVEPITLTDAVLLCSRTAIW